MDKVMMMSMVSQKDSSIVSELLISHYPIKCLFVLHVRVNE